YMSNDFNEKTQEIKADKETAETEGISSDKIVEYTVEIRSNDYDCKGETIRKFTVKTPIYNSFSQMEACADYSDYEYCKEYITENIPTMQEFQLGLQKYKKTLKTTVPPKFTNESASSDKNNNTTTNTTTEKMENKKENKNNKTIIYIIIGAIILLLGVAIVTLILVKKKRSKEV
ncbi:MAG: hypothetical protein K2G03_05565, partial [Bacilli bacterium]|nr:hypothetical protein [Bacilli bacterium]